MLFIKYAHAEARRTEDAEHVRTFLRLADDMEVTDMQGKFFLLFWGPPTAVEINCQLPNWSNKEKTLTVEYVRKALPHLQIVFPPPTNGSI